MCYTSYKVISVTFNIPMYTTNKDSIRHYLKLLYADSRQQVSLRDLGIKTPCLQRKPRKKSLCKKSSILPNWLSLVLYSISQILHLQILIPSFLPVSQFQDCQEVLRISYSSTIPPFVSANVYQINSPLQMLDTNSAHNISIYLVPNHI